MSKHTTAAAYLPGVGHVTVVDRFIVSTDADDDSSSTHALCRTRAGEYVDVPETEVAYFAPPEPQAVMIVDWSLRDVPPTSPAMTRNIRVSRREVERDAIDAADMALEDRAAGIAYMETIIRRIATVGEPDDDEILTAALRALQEVERLDAEVTR